VSELVAKIALARGSEFALEVDLVCPHGITCIMGPSGSGKSTILGVLAGLQVPDRGRVAVGGHVWLDRERGIDVPVHKRRLSYVFQGLALFDRVGVGYLAKRRPRTFSGGEAQRVALARALARSPELVLLDEPFSALDRDLRTQLTSLVRELSREVQVPIVHVTHSIAEARLLADQIIRIDKGRVVARGKPDEVLAGVTTLEE
jgi:molybdate transport system ATP-binding protein